MATAICNDQNQFRIYLREKTRPTMALIFTFAYITSLIARTYGGAFNTRLAMDGMLLLPGLFFGFGVGKRAGQFISKTKRTIWPLVLIYYVDAGLIAAWCELRQVVRHFRLNLIMRSKLQSDDFAGLGEPLIEEWEATQLAGVLPTRNL